MAALFNPYFSQVSDSSICRNFEEHEMLKTVFLTLCALCALMLIGCGNSATTNNNNMSMANANKPAMASSTPAAMTSTPGANAKTSDSGEKIGVPECDEFITAYEACISKNVPEAARAQYKTILAQWRDSWRKAAATPQGKAGLTQACKTAIEQTRASMKQYNCTF